MPLILLIISISLKGYCQRVEIKRDKIYVENQPYAIIESFSSPSTVDFNLKYKTSYSQFKLKNLNNEILAEINPYLDSRNILEVYKIKFLNGETLNYKAGNKVKQKFAEDLVKFGVIVQNKIHRNGLRKLFKNSNQGYPYVLTIDDLPGCSIGRPTHRYLMKCSPNQLWIDDEYYGKYEFKTLTNDSTFKVINFYDKEDKFIGEVKFLSILKTVDTSKEGLIDFRYIKFQFVSADGELLESDIAEFPVNVSFSYFTKAIYSTENCAINWRLTSQVIEIGAYLRKQYFL